MAKYECSKFEAGCFQQLQTYMDKQIGEVKLRVRSVEDSWVDVIEYHVEYALTEFNELHICIYLYIHIYRYIKVSKII